MIKDMSKKKSLVALAVVIAVFVLGWLIMANLSRINPPSNQLPVAQPIPQVSITSNGFVPETIMIKRGEKVKWVNTDEGPHQIASDPHPTHSNLAGLGSLALLTNDSYIFTFDSVGTFTYHDHLNPLKLKGTVIVE